MMFLLNSSLFVVVEGRLGGLLNLFPTWMLRFGVGSTMLIGWFRKQEQAHIRVEIRLDFKQQMQRLGEVLYAMRFPGRVL